MSKPTIQVPTLGASNSTEDPKIATSLQNLQTWLTGNLGIVAADLETDSVTTTKIQNGAVTTAKVADSQVTTAKIADSNVTTAKLADSSVTTDKIAANAVARSDMRIFTIPQRVTALPATVTGSATFSSGSTSVTFAGTGTPQVGQSFSGTNIPSDTVVTAVSGSSGAWTLTISRASTGTQSGSYTVQPQDGDEVFYVADATNGVHWHLRYRSGQTYPWEFVGGSSLTADKTSVSGNSSWQLTTGVGPAIPLAGDYDLTLSLGIWASRTTTASAGNVGASASLAWPTKITQTINNSATTVTINNASASPKSGSSSTVAAIEVAGSGSHEIVTVSNRSSSTLTIARGTNGTSAASHNSGAPIFIIPNPDNQYVEQVGLSVLVPQVPGGASNGFIWGGGSRTYRFTGLEASTTQVPEIFHKSTAGADGGYTLQNIQIQLRPVRVSA